MVKKKKKYQKKNGAKWKLNFYNSPTKRIFFFCFWKQISFLVNCIKFATKEKIVLKIFWWLTAEKKDSETAALKKKKKKDLRKQKHFLELPSIGTELILEKEKSHTYLMIYTNLNEMYGF